MAKDVVFESEKYMQRQETKRKWLPVICLAAILLAVVVIALLMRGARGTVYTGGEDTPYPYSWSVDKKGELKLQIDKSAADGYSWKMAGYDIPGLDIRYPEKEKEGVSTFLLKPNRAGRYVAAFSLVNLEDLSDSIYEWRFMMDSASVTEGETVSAGPLSILSGTGLALSGKQRSTEEDAVAFTMSADGSGGMSVEIINPEQGRFTVEPFEPITDIDEGDVVSEEKRGEEDGGEPRENETAIDPKDVETVTDPAEIEAIVGMPYDEWVEQMKAADAAAAEGTVEILYSYNWTVASDNENAVAPVGVFYTGEMAIASLNAGTEDGTAAIRVYNDLLGLEVFATVENKDGKLTIVSYGSKSYDPVYPDYPEIPEIPEGETAEPEEGAAENEEPAQP